MRDLKDAKNIYDHIVVPEELDDRLKEALKNAPEPKKKTVWPWILSLLVVVIACVCMIPQGRQAIETVLVTGEPGVTRQAFSELVESLRSGGSIRDAVVQFFKEAAAGMG